MIIDYMMNISTVPGVKKKVEKFMLQFFIVFNMLSSSESRFFLTIEGFPREKQLYLLML